MQASQRDLFRLTKVGLGAFGVVTEVTLQCVPRHKLTEQTFVLTRQQVCAQDAFSLHRTNSRRIAQSHRVCESCPPLLACAHVHTQVREHHQNLLHKNRHMRYMWIPYMDAVIVVTCNPGMWCGTTCTGLQPLSSDAAQIVDVTRSELCDALTLLHFTMRLTGVADVRLYFAVRCVIWTWIIAEGSGWVPDIAKAALSKPITDANVKLAPLRELLLSSSPSAADKQEVGHITNK